MSLITELKRRSVFRVAAAYLVVGWLLTEVLTTILPTLGAPDWVSKAVILVFAFGFIPAVVFSWVYELTPEGIKREHEVDRDASVTQMTGRKLHYVTVSAVVLLVLFLAFFSARQSIDQAPDIVPTVSTASVAVLPFENMSNDRDNDYFSDGLTETLLHMLSQVPDLKVAARTSSFAFKNQSKTIGEIAAALEVAHVLEGSVQRVGDRVRITAQLIRASDGFHVWSESYDRTLDDIFAIQDEIAGRVGTALSVSLLGNDGGSKLAGVRTSSPDAYDLYLKARSERATYSYGGLQAAEDLLKGALTVDPNFVDAKTELADIYIAQVETGLMEEREALAEITAITDQVLAVDEGNIEARATRLFVETMVLSKEGSPQMMFDAIRKFEDMVVEAPGELQPRLLLTRLYQGVQQFESALPMLLGALNRDPFNPRIHYELGSIYAALERPGEARAALKKSLEIEPVQPNAYAILASLSLREGDGLDYLQQFLKAVAVDPKDHELPGIVAAFLYELGLIEEGDDFRDRVVAIAPTSEIAYQIELLRAINTGDEAAAVASARRAIEDDINDRRFSYGNAVQHLLRVAASNGTVAEETAYLERHAPGILDIESESTPLKYRFAQFAAFDAWYTVLPHDELLRRLNHLWEIAKTFGVDPLEDPGTHLAVLALQGKVDEAIELALAEVFSEPVTMNQDWRRRFAQAQYAEILADARVRAALERWENDEKQLRQKVRNYLADLQASS
ncbi:MAG: hypothetical protein OEO82_00335 [Gammaproteobacteria bacterium]|nr:hypothetical protein [Gammaproteobacteria bacterium]